MVATNPTGGTGRILSLLKECGRLNGRRVVSRLPASTYVKSEGVREAQAPLFHTHIYICPPPGFFPVFQRGSF